MSTVKSKKLQVGTDATSSNNFTIYQPSTPDGTLRIGVGNADSPTEVGRFDSNGYIATNAPAFRATASTSQTFTGGVAQKVTLGTEVWDTTSNFDNVTNYRFTPTVAGYYQVNGGYSFTTAGSAGWTLFTYIAKNGSEHIRGAEVYSLTGTFNQSVVNGVVYMNGTTDYIELYAMSIGGNINTGSTGFCFMDATLIRKA